MWARNNPKNVSSVSHTRAQTVLQRALSREERIGFMAAGYTPEPTTEGYQRAISIGKRYINACEEADNLDIIKWNPRKFDPRKSLLDKLAIFLP